MPHSFRRSFDHAPFLQKKPPRHHSPDIEARTASSSRHWQQTRTSKTMPSLLQGSQDSPGLLGLLSKADLTLLASGAVVFGVQRLVPTYDASWYKAIKKPTWTPPNWVFPAVWIPLKVLQSVALWLVLKQADSRKQLVLPLSIFGLHLFLGNWWNVVFFGQRKMEESVNWMGAFWASIAAGIASFATVSPLAAALFAPTQVWVTVAAKLNYDIVRLNSDAKKSS